MNGSVSESRHVLELCTCVFQACVRMFFVATLCLAPVHPMGMGCIGVGTCLSHGEVQGRGGPSRGIQWTIQTELSGQGKVGSQSTKQPSGREHLPTALHEDSRLHPCLSPHPQPAGLHPPEA